MNRWLIVVGLSVGLAWSANGQSTTTSVFPVGLDNQTGNSGIVLFSSNPDPINQYQQLFRSSELQKAWQTPVSISAVAFRVNNGASAFQAVIPTVEIRFSTSATPLEQMSSNYAQNKGSDELTVFLHQNVALSGAGGAGPNPFDIRFNFDRPFVYDPSKGNLLMYIATGFEVSGKSSQLDAQEYATFSGTPVISFGNGYLGPSPVGLVSQFSSTTVPEPKLFQLAVLSGVIFFASMRRRS
jgi:hypothetical protein